MKLTKEAVDKLQYEGKQAFFWDDKQPGFGVRISKTSKVYIAQGIVKNGKERRVSLGKHGVLTADEARKKAIKILSQMNDGIDPSEEKRKAKAVAVTLEQVVKDYISDRSLKTRSIIDIEMHINTTFSDWKNKPIVKINRDAVLKKFKEKSKVSHAQANQSFRIMRALINYAAARYRKDEPFILENPVKILSEMKLWNQVKPRNQKIPTDKIGMFWNWLQGMRTAPEQTPLSRCVADVFCFLLLTGTRKNEAFKLKWESVDLEDGSFRLDDPKSGNAVILPLSKTLIEILEQRPKDNEFVFPGQDGSTHMKDARKSLKKSFDLIGCQIAIHDLRRTFRAIAGLAGAQFINCKLLLNHSLGKMGDITLDYYTERNDLRYLREDAEKISQWVIRQGAIASKSKVVPFPVKKGVVK
jgi:integrase